MNLQQETNIIAAALLCKSRRYENKYLNTDTGVYFDTFTASELLKFNLKDIDVPEVEKAELVAIALHGLDLVDGNTAIQIEEAKPVWRFFRDYFVGKEKTKIPMIPLYKAYIAEFGHLTQKSFYHNLAEWVIEMKIDRTVYDKGVNRKVIIER